MPTSPRPVDGWVTENGCRGAPDDDHTISDRADRVVRPYEYVAMPRKKRCPTGSAFSFFILLVFSDLLGRGLLLLQVILGGLHLLLRGGTELCAGGLHLRQGGLDGLLRAAQGVLGVGVGHAVQLTAALLGPVDDVSALLPRLLDDLALGDDGLGVSSAWRIIFSTSFLAPAT